MRIQSDSQRPSVTKSQDLLAGRCQKFQSELEGESVAVAISGEVFFRGKRFILFKCSAGLASKSYYTTKASVRHGGFRYDRGEGRGFGD